MLEQNILQVYLAESGNVIIASGMYEGLGKSVDIQHIAVSVDDLSNLAAALNELANELS